VLNREGYETSTILAAKALIRVDISISSAISLRDSRGRGGDDTNYNIIQSNQLSKGEIGIKERGEALVNYIREEEDSRAIIDFISFDTVLNPTTVGVVINYDLPHLGISS
jgi:hypothetical protein